MLQNAKLRASSASIFFHVEILKVGFLNRFWNKLSFSNSENSWNVQKTLF